MRRKRLLAVMIVAVCVFGVVCGLAVGTPEVATAETTAYAWGANSSGQLGDGSTSGQFLPVPVSGTPKLVEISASEDFTVAIASDGTAWAWGGNASGQLGNGTYNNSDVPVPVSMPAGVTFTAIAANAGGCCRGHVIALDSTGKLWGWGADDFNDNGTGAATNIPEPNTVLPSGVSFKAVGAGADAGFAVAADGTPYGWGDNGDGDLNFPTGVKFTSVAGGCDIGWGLDATGQAYAWGADYNGQLGTGGTGPGKVIMPAGVSFQSISPGRCQNGFSVAVGTNGHLYAWGENGNGQLGDGTTTSRNSPGPVAAPSGASFVAASAGGAHAVALDSTGHVWSWGDNSQGQLGIGAGPGQPTPQMIQQPTAVTFDHIAAGDYHSVAAAAGGSVGGGGGSGVGGGGGSSAAGTSSCPPGEVGVLPSFCTPVVMKTLTATSRGQMWGCEADADTGSCQIRVWGYQLDLTAVGERDMWSPPSGRSPYFWSFPAPTITSSGGIYVSMELPGGANSYGIRMDPSVGAYINNNALNLRCGGHPGRYDVPLASAATADAPQATVAAGVGSYPSAGFDAPMVFGTGTASSEDTYNAGAVTGVATPASVQFPESCSSAAHAADVAGSTSSPARRASRSTLVGRTRATLGLPQFRGRGHVCLHLLALLICTPRPPAVTVGSHQLSAAAVAYVMQVVAAHDHLRLGKPADVRAAVAVSVLDSMLHQVVVAGHLEPAVANARASELMVLDAARSDPSGARAVGLTLRGGALTRFLLSPQQVDGLRILEAKDRLWRQILGGATGTRARSRVIAWFDRESKRLNVRIAGVPKFSLTHALVGAIPTLG
jgi:alpha-tubulin suppressor-like RCC1 family protein